MTSNLSAELLRNIHLDTPMYTATQVSSLTKIDNNTIIRNLSSELQVSEVIDDSFEKTFELSSQAFPRGITDIYYANGLWVACTNTRGILKSTDGTTWTDTNKTTGHFFSCYYANGLWLTGSDQGGIWKSTDGNTWSQTSKTDDNIRTIIYINGLWLAGDFDGRGIWKSTDGNTWTHTTKTKGHIISIHYANGLFVAVAGYNEGIWKSTDGNTWSKTSQTAGSFRSVNYACGLWLATSLETGLWTSTDGNTWSNVPNVPRSPQTIYCSCYANGVWLVGTDGFGIYKSTDGKIWSKTSLLLEHVYTVHYNNGMFIVGTMDGIFKSKIHAAYSPSYEAMNDKDSIDTIHTDILKALDTEISARKDADNLLSAAISASTPVRLSADNNTINITNNIIKTSSVADDGWTQTAKTNGWVYSVYYANGLWVAGSYNTGIWKSTDGNTWTQTAKTDGSFISIHYANGLWLAGSSGDGIWKSTDGNTWIQTNNPNGWVYPVYYANGLWVAGSNVNTGIGIWKSTDGNTWSKTAQTNGWFNSIYYTNGLWIAGTGDNAGIWKSTDGNTWTQTAKTDGSFQSIHYANGLWLAGSMDNTGIWKSTDGNTWTQTAKTDGSFISIHYANGLWLASGGDTQGNDNGIWKSTDGNTWTQTAKTDGNFFSIHYANGLWLAGSERFGIWKSNIHASYNPDNKLQVTNNYGSVSQKYIAGQGISISGDTISAIPDSLKQDKLTAGSNISIVNNVITANIPPLSGGGTINIDNNTLITNSENKVQVADMINESWKVVNSTNKNFNKIICNNNVILAGCSDLGGLYRSEDFGESWNIVSADSGSSGVDLLSSITVDSFGYNNSQYVVATHTPPPAGSLRKDNWVLASNDSGKTWRGDLTSARVGQVESQDRLISLVHTHNKWLGGVIDGGILEHLDSYPNGISQGWEKIKTFLDLNLTDIVNDSNNISCLLAGTDSNGMYKSTDFGQTWVPLLSVNPTLSIGKIYRFDSDSIVYSIMDGNLYKSTDFGDTWNSVVSQSSLSSGYIVSMEKGGGDYDMDLYIGTADGKIFCQPSFSGNSWTNVITPQDVGAINNINYTSVGFFATTNKGILKSMDGKMWTTVYTDSTSFAYIEKIIYINRALIAVGSNGSYISPDGGLTWTKETTVQFINDIIDVTNFVLVSSINGLYKSNGVDITRNTMKWSQTTQTNESFVSLYCADDCFAGLQASGGIIKSDDYGNTWKTTNKTTGTAYSFARAYGEIFACCSDGVWKSPDGNTWTQTTFSDSGITYAIIRTNNKLIVGGVNGIWTSTDGDRWIKTPFNGQVQCLCFNSNTVFFGSMDNSGIWKSVDDGQTWTQTKQNTGSFRSISASGGTYIACGRSGGLYRSIDGGNTWEYIFIDQHTSFYVCHYTGDFWLAGSGIGNTGIWKSVDSGTTWIQTNKNTGDFESICSGRNVDGDFCLAGSTNREGIWKYKAIETCSLTWTQVPNATDINGKISPVNNTLFSSNSTGGYSTSLDDGATWTKKTFPVYTYKTFYKDSEKDILAGTKTGILKSIDYGTSWIPTSQKSGEYNSIDCWNGLYIAGSTNLGLWYSNNGTTWTQTNKKDGTFSSVKCANGIWLASGLDNVWKSIDGLNWTETNKKRDTSGSVNNDIGHTNSSWFVGTGNSIVQSNIGTFLSKYPIISYILDVLKRNNLK